MNSTQRTQSTAQAATPGHHLVQLLASLGHRHLSDESPCFAERLGRLFGLADTMNLDAALALRKRDAQQSQQNTVDSLRQGLAAMRQSLTDQLNASFATRESRSAPGLPVPKMDDDSPDVSRYQRFYLARQRAIVAGIRQQRLLLRKALAQHSPALAQLAELDTVFESTLSNFVGQSFSVVPIILEKRFDALWQAHQHAHPTDAQSPEDWLAPGAWLHQFCQDMKRLLLAELDVRLEPVLGLLDALNQEVTNNT
ncbi:DUF3348 family protein [Marinobacter sp. SS21]|uniref:DUF3348 family protein n=1 Tax=Marinobacter sp. SS21 TaxID=2979460 RepID=UPI002330879B|nr:DUF3348 family protein [Marinobacter sp. SS21]MDC0664340.1 DUF3348 family protein [Marinobacter sp. SS21]